MDTLAPAWQPDLPVSDEVEQAMQNLSDEIAASSQVGRKVHSKCLTTFKEISCEEFNQKPAAMFFVDEILGLKAVDEESESEAMLPWFLTEQAY